ncbi:ferredoxin [Yinghuangia sp. ASG 101]|uniref:ferredoxin n=1 Tax=Yinghuangia sp. ASG 101 TaxID=2896848 RepID=UPI001E35DBF2|nr:ferredoxin [Yinghuangia sp. ASG 101]UGQ12456.1 ferredoxin [Yinghuangia sp. ASG 101]
MKAVVDQDRCEGHARCWEICPEVFSLDEAGNAFAPSAEVPPEHAAKAREAEANCPERAITLT